MSLTGKPPMTETEAREVIAEMRKRTKRNARRQTIHHALSGYGNISEEARAVYEAALLDPTF